MNLDELRPILAAYRQQVEPAWSPATAHPGFDGKAGDPAGQCGVTSAWLQRRLREDHGIGSTLCIGAVFVAGALRDLHHCWLELDTTEVDVIVDLTADQFRGFEDRQVICEAYSALLEQNWATYEARSWLAEQEVSRDPVQPRLTILTEALS